MSLDADDAGALQKKKDMHDPHSIKTIDLYPGVSTSYIGPDLDAGPLPGLFYLALAAHESLGVDPYNQPTAYLSSLPMRIFTIDFLTWQRPFLSRSFEELGRRIQTRQRYHLRVRRQAHRDDHRRSHR